MSDITDEEIIELLRQGWGAKRLKSQHGVGWYRFKRLKGLAVRRGWSPQHDMTHTVPDGYHVKGTSTLYDDAGQPKLQWVKSSIDHERQHEMMLAAVTAMSADIERMPPMPAPSDTDSALCNLYTLTDTHVGMLAWRKEGGADWDLRIAERTIVGAFGMMMHGAPRARVGIVNQLGDMLHFDGLEAVTPTSRNQLDADGRFSKVVETAIRILRRIIDMALAAHDEVQVILAEGNHDLASSVWLRKMFAALYEDEPRLTVNDSELPYYVYQHGQTMLGFHHGHIKGNSGLPLLFASQYPEIWGSTRKRYAHTGHRHHVEEKEHSGMTVVQHPTLAARDAHASRGGYVADRQAVCITYHDQRGKVGSYHVSPEMLDSGAA